MKQSIGIALLEEMVKLQLESIIEDQQGQWMKVEG